MEKVLPSEILIQIFLYLPVEDLQSVSDTCTYWKYIIENFNLWKTQWIHLLKQADSSSLRHDTCAVLKELNCSDLNLKYSCLRLRNLICNQHNLLHSCLMNTSTRKYDYAVLKTHHSHIALTIFSDSSSPRNRYFYFLKKRNDVLLTSEAYVDFRNPPKIIENIDKLFDNKQHNLAHVHIKVLMYFYPMGVGKYVQSHFLKQFFETCHVDEVILIPRVVVLCENLDVKTAVVVYSTSRTTEIAVVVNGRVLSNRWREIPIGGWKVAENLHATFRWLHPNTETSIGRFDNADIKEHCWVKMSPANDKREAVSHLKAVLNDDGNEELFIMKNEQYLAAEVMYAELELYSVIKNLLDGLPEDVVSSCLSHVLLAGGNCQLKHMNIRLKLDLMKILPQYANIIATSVHNGQMLAYSVHMDNFQLSPTKKFEVGRKSRLKREHYIVGDF